MHRPIIITGGINGDGKEKILNETNAGFYTKGMKDIKNILKQTYLEYKDKGEIDYYGNEKEISKYSHHEMARKFAKILYRFT